VRNSFPSEIVSGCVDPPYPASARRRRYLIGGAAVLFVAALCLFSALLVARVNVLRCDFYPDGVAYEYEMRPNQRVLERARRVAPGTPKAAALATIGQVGAWRDEGAAGSVVGFLEDCAYVHMGALSLSARRPLMLNPVKPNSPYVWVRIDAAGDFVGVEGVSPL
jgi:hypothetical protein